MDSPPVWHLRLLQVVPLQTLLCLPSHSPSTAHRVPHVLTSATGGLRLVSNPGSSARFLSSNSLTVALPWGICFCCSLCLAHSDRPGWFTFSTRSPLTLSLGHSLTHEGFFSAWDLTPSELTLVTYLFTGAFVFASPIRVHASWEHLQRLFSLLRVPSAWPRAWPPAGFRMYVQGNQDLQAGPRGPMKPSHGLLAPWEELLPSRIDRWCGAQSRGATFISELL